MNIIDTHTNGNVQTGIKVLYFSHAACSVCNVLKPKVAQMVRDEFKNVMFEYIDIRKQPSVAADFSVFAVPTVLLLADGKEMLRFVRSFGIDQIREKLTRYVQLYD